MLTQLHEKNAFLAQLSAPEFALLRTHLAPVDLRVGDSLHFSGDRIEHVIFPHSGMIALTVPLRDNAGAGVALIGCEAIVGGFAVAASAPATCDAEVHVAGKALRMSASAFRYALEQNAALRRLAARFDSAMLAHAQQAASCNASHPVEARICRYLLEVKDCCRDNKIPLTQATLGQLLSVRRTTVTLVAGRLEAAGVLHCRRGYMQIVDSEQLELRACECYSHLKQHMAKLFESAEDVSIVAPISGTVPSERRLRTDTLG